MLFFFFQAEDGIRDIGVTGVQTCALPISLGLLLPHHVLLEDIVDLPRLGEVLDVERGRSGQLLVDDLVAEIDALVADVHARPGDELLDLPLALAAEAAEQLLVAVGRACHVRLSACFPASATRSRDRRCRSPWPRQPS